MKILLHVQVRVFKDSVREEDHRLCNKLTDLVLIDWWWGNRVLCPESPSFGSNQCEVYLVPVVSM